MKRNVWNLSEGTMRIRGGYFAACDLDCRSAIFAEKHTKKELMSIPVSVGSEADGRATLAKRCRNHSVITQKSPSNHPLLAGIWKHVACMLLAFTLGVGQMWGTDNEFTCPTSGSLSAQYVYKITGTNSSLDGNKLYYSTSGPANVSGDFGLEATKLGLVFKPSENCKMTVKMSNNNSSASSITAVIYKIYKPSADTYIYPLYTNNVDADAASAVVTAVGASSSSSDATGNWWKNIKILKYSSSKWQVDGSNAKKTLSGEAIPYRTVYDSLFQATTLSAASTKSDKSQASVQTIQNSGEDYVFQKDTVYLVYCHRAKSKVGFFTITFEAASGGGGGCTPITPTWSTDYSSTVLTAGGSNSSTPTVGKDGSSGAVSFAVTSASPSGSVTVNSSTGVVTPVKVGTATITATVAANGDYCSGTVTKNFTIKGTITYNANGDGAGNATGTTGSVPTDANLYASGASITVAGKSTLAKTNCAFAGWNTAANGTGTWYDPGASISMGESNITLYAQWAPCISTADFDVLAAAVASMNLANTQSSLTANNIKHSLGGDTRYDNSSGYSGLKLRHSGDWIGFGVAAGSEVTITTQTVNTSPTVTIDFSSATTLSANTDNEYAADNSNARYFRIKAADGAAVVINQITITVTCTAPDHVEITPTEEDGNYGWRYSTGETLKLTATPYDDGDDEITSGITGYQWQKYVESTWTDLEDDTNISGATTANLQISNLTTSNGGSYRCNISTGATCTTSSDGYFVRIFTLYGGYSGGSYSNQPIVWTGEKRGTVTVNLNASSSYKFKFTDNNGRWFGNGGTISKDFATEDDGTWGFGTSASDATLSTGSYGGGDYVLTVDITHFDDGGSKYVNLRSVVYPKKTTYLQLCSDWKAATAKYAAYYWNGGSNGWTDFMETYDCDGDIRYADIPVWATDAFFVRFNPDKSSTGNYDYEWNRSGDNASTLPTDGKDYYNSLSVGGNGKYYGSWGTYSPTTYTISFAGNGSDGGSMSNISSIACDADQALTANSFEKTGHNFSCWHANVDVKVGGATVTAGSTIADEATIEDIRSNITLTAQWTPKTYSISLNGNGGSGNTSSVTATYNSATLSSSITNPTYSGHTFLGWYSGEGGTGNLVIDVNGVLQANVTSYTGAGGIWTKESGTTLYAKWEENCYSFTPSGDNGTIAVGNTVSGSTGGTMKVSTAKIVKTAENRLRFDHDDDAKTHGSVLVTLNNYMQAGTIISLSIHNPAGDKTRGLILTDKNGTKVSTCTHVTAGVKHYLYTVVAGDGLEGEYRFVLKRSQSAELVALSVAYCGADRYTVTYKANGGTGDDIVNPTATTVASNSFTAPTGYHFNGWNTGNDGGGTAYAVGATVDDNLTLYAQWTANTYSISYKDQGNASFSGLHIYTESYALPNTHTYGSSTTLHKATKDGYVFGGWYTNKECTEGPVTSLGATAYTADIKLYAKWTAMSLDALANNTLYKVEDMVPDGITPGSQARRNPGVSENNRFNIRGTNSSSSSSAAGMTPRSESRTIDGTSFTNVYRFDKPASGTDGTDLGSGLPDNHAIQFKISAAGKLDIYCYYADSIYIVKDGGSAEVLSASKSLQKVTKSVTAGTYYLYSTHIGSNQRLYGLKFTPVYTLTNAVSPAGYGAVDVASVSSIPSGTSTSSSLNTYTVNGTTVTATPAATTAQYTYAFSSWSSLPATVTANSTVTANFTRTARSYTVTLNTNDGTINSGDVTSYTYGTGATLPTDVTKDDNIFMGWYANEELTGEPVLSIANDATGDKEYWAKWLEASASICVDLNTTWLGTYTAAHNGTYALLDGVKYDVEARADDASYLEMGWLDDDDRDTYFQLNIEDLGTIKAVKITIDNIPAIGEGNYGIVGDFFDESGFTHYNLSSHWDDGDNWIETTSISTGTLLLQPVSGDNNSFAFQTNSATIQISQICIYYEEASSFTVTYADGGKTGGGAAPTDANSPYDPSAEVTVLGNVNNMTKGTDVFRGWTDGTTFFLPGQKFNITSNVTLTAVWEGTGGSCTTLAQGTQNAEHTAMTATVGTITTTGGQAQDGYIKLSGSSSQCFVVTAKAGYTISAGDKLTMRVYNKASSADNIGFQINSTAHTASIAATSEGDVIYTLLSTDISDGAVTIKRNDSKDRYHSILLERCVVSNFTVSFADGNTAPASHLTWPDDIEGVPSGDKILQPTAPTASGYIFGGWYTNAACSSAFSFSGTITKDTTLYAKWTAKTAPTQYTVTIDAATVCSGSSTNIKMASSQSGVSYQLYKGEDKVGDAKAGGSALTWSSISATGTYKVMAVENATYAAREMSNTVSLANYDAVSIKTHPTSEIAATVDVGSDMSVVLNTGTFNNATYTWQTCTDATPSSASDISSGSQYANYNTATMTFTPAAEGTYYFRCKVTDDCGTTVYSNVATVTASVAKTDPTVYELSGTTSVCEGDAATLTLEDSDDGVTYALYLDGVDQSDDKVGDGNAITWTVTAAGTYTVKAEEDEDYNEADMDGSAVISYKTATAIGTQPSTAVSGHDGVNFTLGTGMVATGQGDLSYKWYSYTNSDAEGEAVVAGATSATYTTSKAYASGSKYYYKVEVTAACGSVKSNIITVTIDNKHLLTYDANGGSGAPSAIWKSSGSMTLSDTEPTRTNYRFLGWNTKNDGTGDHYDAGASYTMGTSAVTLYAEWGETATLTWNLNVNTAESSIGTASKASTNARISNSTDMTNLANYGSLTISSSAKESLTSKIETPTAYNSGKYMYVTFDVPEDYEFVPTSISVKVQPVGDGEDKYTILDISDENNNLRSTATKCDGTSKGKLTTVTLEGDETALKGTVTLKIYVYNYSGTSTTNNCYRLGSPITISGTLAEVSGYTVTATATTNMTGMFTGSTTITNSPVVGIESGTSVSSSDNTFTIGETTVTAPATIAGTVYVEAESDYVGGCTWRFDQWNNLPATVTADVDDVEAEYIPTFGITYNTNGGTINAGQVDWYEYTGSSSNEVTLPTNVTKDGYTFVKWMQDCSEWSGEDVERSVITCDNYGNFSLYAVWTPNNYTITYNLNGASWASSAGVAEYTVGTGATLPLAGAMTNVGYTFDGWYANSDLSTGGVVTSISTSDYGDKEYWAKWTENSYTITYDKNNGSATGSTSNTVGHYVTVADCGFELANNIFMGWNTKDDGSGASYAAGEDIELTANMTLYAQWASDFDVAWTITKIDSKLYRGGGGYTVTAVIDDASWDAVAADANKLELSATDGVTLRNVTKSINGDSKAQITANFDISTDVDEDATQISFTLSVPANNGYGAKDDVDEEDLDACPGGGSTTVFSLTSITGVGSNLSTSAKDVGAYYDASSYCTLNSVSDGVYVGGCSWSGSFSGKNLGYESSYHAWSFAQNMIYLALYSATGFAAGDVVTMVEGTSNTQSPAFAKASASTLDDLKNTDYNHYTAYQLTMSSETAPASGNSYTYTGTIPAGFTSSNWLIVYRPGQTFKLQSITITRSGGSGGVTPTLTWDSDPTSAYDEFSAIQTNIGDELTYTASTTSNTLGAITYSIAWDDEPGGTINPTTGKVQVTGPGNARITATLAEAGCYDGTSITYDIYCAAEACSDPFPTITTNDLGCSGIELSVQSGSSSYQWYKDDETIGGATSNTYTATSAGEYYVIVTNSCDRASNTVEIEAKGSVSASNIVDNWYVKNGRRTPDVALVQTTDATGFFVKIGDDKIWDEANDVTTGFGGCGFYLGEDGIIYLKGQKNDGTAPSGLDANKTLKITATGCSGNADELSINIKWQDETDRPSVAFVSLGTEKGAFTDTTAGYYKTTPLYKYLDYTLGGGAFDLTAQNIYSTVDEQALREHYSQFDAILITDDPNTGKKKDGKSYVDAMGALIDIRPMLTMEAFVSALSNWKAKGINGNPTSPNPRQYGMKLECKDHEIFTGLSAGGNVKVETIDDVDYWTVLMVDSTKSPYNGVAYNASTSDKPALQGFSASNVSGLMLLGEISDGALYAGVERQDEPAARLMLLGLNNKALPNALTDEGKRVISNALEYLCKTNMEDVDDCSNYFKGTVSGHETEWNQALNWSKEAVPTSPTVKVRILAPVELPASTTVRVHHVDIVVGGKSKEIAGTPNGSMTIPASSAMVVTGTVTRATAPYYGIEDLMPTEVNDIYIAATSTNNGTLILNNEAGTTKATVEMYSKGGKVDGKKRYQYIGTPHSDVNNAQYNYYGSWLYEWTGDAWSKIKNGAAVHPWTGYCISYPTTGHTYVMEGTLVATTEKDIAVGADQNMVVGNSWTAPMYIKNFTDDDFDNLVGNVYFFNTGADKTGTAGAASTRYEASTYVTVPIHSSPYTGDSLISSMQGFFVKSSGSEGTLHLDYNRLVRPTGTRNVVSGEMHAPKRVKAENEEPNVLKLTVRGENYDDRLVLLQREDFSEGFDNGWDGDKWDGNSSSLYLYTPDEEGGDLSVSALPELEGTVVGFRAGEDNAYTIYFDYSNAEEPLYWYDADTRTYTRIVTGEGYRFFTNDKEKHTRFLITRTNGAQTPTGIEDGSGGDGVRAKKFILENKLFIMVNGKLYDATGKVVK